MTRGKTNYPPGGVDTSDATAIAADILNSKTAYGAAGTKITGTLALTGDAVVGDVLSGKKFYKDNPTSQQTGTMVDRGTVNITPSTSNQSIEAGKHSGSGVVYGDADLVAGNIKTGVNIFGVTGNLAPAPSYETETYVNAGPMSSYSLHVYYVKLGKLYVFGTPRRSSGTQYKPIASDATTRARICSVLGITQSAYYETLIATSAYMPYWNGSAWVTDSGDKLQLLAILAA